MSKKKVKQESDNLSIPLEVNRTKLGIKYTLPIRNNPHKPGRTLAVVWDDRFPLKPRFRNKYSYLVNFSHKESIAGNHIHKKKSEFFIPVKGSFQVILLDPITQIKETIELTTGEALFIPAKIAHVVIAKTPEAILTVIANYPNNDLDEFKFSVV